MTDSTKLPPLPEGNVAHLIAAKISSLEAAAKEAYDYTNMPMEVDPRYILELIAYIQALLEEHDALRAEVVELRAARIAYASEFPEAKDGLPDTGSIHANIRSLKARAERLAEALRLIESAKDRGFGIDYARGVAQSVLLYDQEKGHEQ